MVGREWWRNHLEGINNKVRSDLDPTRRTRDGIGARRTFPQWGRENEVRRCAENLPAMGERERENGRERE